MHAAAAPARTTALPAIQLGDELHRRDTLGERVTMSAVGAEDNVLRAQMRAYAGRDRLLADVGVASAVDQAALVRFDQLLLGAANQQHLPIKLQQFFRGDFAHKETPHQPVLSV